MDGTGALDVHWIVGAMHVRQDLNALVSMRVMAVGTKALGTSLGEAASCAHLHGSSKYSNIIQHINCSRYDIYFIDAIGILHKKVLGFNSTLSAIVVPHILKKYLLHASHDSLGHVGATKLYHFLKQLYYFQGKGIKLYQYVRSCHKCQIINLQKPNLFTYTKTFHKPQKTYPHIQSSGTIQCHLTK